MRKLSHWLFAIAVVAIGCDGGGNTTLSGGTGGGDDGAGNSSNDGGSTGAGNSNQGGDTGQGGNPDPIDPALAAREVDYNEALRTASVKLVRHLPTLAQIKKIQDATDQKQAYTEEVDAMLASPEFDARMIKFWRDTMRMGGNDLDTAPVLAAKLMAENRPFTEIFTASTGNCPTYDAAAGTFADADCQSGAPVQAGVLTNPAVMKQFYGNMAFRRVRWLQEIFYCSKFPAEVAATPKQIDGKDFTSPWEFSTVSTTPINFQDTQSVVCANCHTTLNHIAPAFANFDENGMWQNQIAVNTPIAPQPVKSELSHWLSNTGDSLAWRQGEPITNLSDLATVLADDPAVSECLVARMWNFAMSKEDIVTDLATVPYSVVEPHIIKFDSNGQNLKAVLRDIVLSDDFVSF
ncbi:MAG: DUF1549 domain-containing protein [Polyangiaceae bacterium]